MVLCYYFSCFLILFKINVEAWVRKAVQAKLQKPDADIFEPAQNQVRCFPCLTKTNSYNDLSYYFTKAFSLFTGVPSDVSPKLAKISSIWGIPAPSVACEGLTSYEVERQNDESR